MAAPQYGQPAAAGETVSITKEQWASLNPYGSASAYPANERPQIEEIQRQWERFYEVRASYCPSNLHCLFTVICSI